MDTVCGVSGGPPWLFEVMLAAGGVALIYAAIWITLLVTQGNAAVDRGRSPWLRLAFGLVALIPAAALVENGAEEALNTLILLAVCSPAVATLVVWARQGSRSGIFPPARSAPLGMFWVLVAASGLASGVSLTALVAQFALGHTTPC